MNMYQDPNSTKIVAPEHNLVMHSRKQLELTGVKKVETFDQEEFLLETALGFLTIRGQELTMKNFDIDKGTVAIRGKVNEILYFEEDQLGDKTKGFFSKLFK